MGLALQLLLEKINTRLDELQLLLDNQTHLSDFEKVIECIESVSKFWSVLDDEQKDFIDCARYAIDKQIEWK